MYASRCRPSYPLEHVAGAPCREGAIPPSCHHPCSGRNPLDMPPIPCFCCLLPFPSCHPGVSPCSTRDDSVATANQAHARRRRLASLAGSCGPPPSAPPWHETHGLLNRVERLGRDGIRSPRSLHVPRGPTSPLIALLPGGCTFCTCVAQLKPKGNPTGGLGCVRQGGKSRARRGFGGGGRANGPCTPTTSDSQQNLAWVPWHAWPPLPHLVQDVVELRGVRHDFLISLLQRRQVRDQGLCQHGLEVAPPHLCRLTHHFLLAAGEDMGDT